MTGIRRTDGRSTPRLRPRIFPCGPARVGYQWEADYDVTCYPFVKVSGMSPNHLSSLVLQAFAISLLLSVGGNYSMQSSLIPPQEIAHDCGLRRARYPTPDLIRVTEGYNVIRFPSRVNQFYSYHPTTTTTFLVAELWPPTCAP